MSDITDFETALAQIAVATATAIEEAEVTAVSAATIIGAAVIAVTALVALINHVDEIADAVKQLEAHFDAILNAEGQVIQMRDVADKLHTARALLDPIAELGPGQTLTDAQRSTMDVTSYAVVGTLGDISYWKRPFFTELVYSDTWSGFLTPDPALRTGSLVFDYRLTLPAYVEAIVIRLIVILALDGKLTANRQSEIATIAGQLETYYNMIRAAIVTIRPPALADTESLMLNASNWDRGGAAPLSPPDPVSHRIYGAVEKYSTFRVTDHWPDQSPYGPPFSNILPTDDQFHRFSGVLALGSLARWKKVYAGVGLDSVRRFLLQLKALAGQPPARPQDSGSGWSLREVDHLLATTMLNQPSTGSPQKPISAVNLLTMIVLNEPAVPRKIGATFAT
jgi:hypothetical protein